MAIEGETAVRTRIEDAAPLDLRLHRIALIEIAVFLLGAVAVQWWLLDPRPLADLKPHPFWILVILVSLQYGTVDGLAAATACIATQWFLGWPHASDEEYVARVSSTLGEPILWLGAAIVIGEFRLRQIRTMRALRAQLEEVGRQRDLLEISLAETNERSHRLESRLAAVAPNRSTELLEALSALQRDARHGTSRELPLAACAEIALEADRLTLFELVEGALVATIRIRADAGAALRSRFDPGDAVYERIVRHRAVLSTLRENDRVILADQGLFAVPISSPTTGKVLGMLKIEHMRALNITPAAEKCLIALCAHLASVLDRTDR